jgi:hypothetical protein
MNRLEQYFVQWRTTNLHLILGGEPLLAQAFARWLLEKNYEYTVNSEKHSTTIQAKSMISFLTEKCTRESIKQRLFYQVHKEAIQEIADAATLSGIIASNNMEDFKAYVQKTWFPLPSNTQFVESGVKDAKLCATKNRDELMCSTYIPIRSTLVS